MTVGHTHNGNDAAHSVHNQIAGNYPSVTPAELFNAYSYAWASERTRPQPIIMECQFAWHERFSQPTSGHQPISGFTITQNNPYNVRAFRFKAVQQSSTRKCELQIKGSPLEEKWRGENSVLGGEGFFILNHLLEGFPKLKKPHAYEMPKAYLNGIKSAKFRAYCESIGRSMMHEHLVTMAETLIIPSLGPVTSEELSDLAPSRQKSLSGYGPVEWIGVRRKSGLLSHLVPFIRDQMFDETTFWDVGAGPVHPELFLDPVSIPIVRYSTRVHHEKTPRKKRKKVSRIRANVLLEEEDNQQLDEDNTQPADSKIQASDEESKSQAMEEDQDLLGKCPNRNFCSDPSCIRTECQL